ncbi:MAG: DUF4358 domain-containing protein [Lachnospiraceae bacterium]|nr:DUF4358 domain-containing protein [Lachnospiraceae bacterium]
MKRKSLLVLGVSVLLAAAVLGGCGKKDGDTDPTGTPEATPTMEATPTPEPEKDPAEVLAEIHQKIKEAYGDKYLPNMPYEDMMFSEMMGIDSSLYDVAIGEGPMISTNVERFTAFHATEGNAEALKTAVLAYQDRLKNDTFQYPMNVPKIQASVVETVGDYVFFYMLGAVETTSYNSQEEAIAPCIEANKIATDIIHEVLGK